MNLEKMKTRLPADWLAKVLAGNPAKLLPDGRIVGPPARLSYAFVVTPAKDRVENGVTKKGKYETNLLFPFTLANAMQHMAALSEARKKLIREKYANNPEGAGFDSPFKDQGIMVGPLDGGTNKQGKTSIGFVPGDVLMRVRANNKPALAHLVNGVPTAAAGPDDDMKKIFYSGCWVLPTLSVFKSTADENPNVFFGLEALLKIADDDRLGGSGGGAAVDYGQVGVNIESPVDPAGYFNDAGASAASVL